jgi:SNF2 family DNA or RNA helicase
VSSKLIRQWNNGELDILVVHPASLSHGVNMQSGPGRDLIWMGLTDSLELFMQLNKRLHRQGVVGQVRIHKIIAKDTVDMINKKRLDDKEATQQSLLDALKLYSKESGE